MTRLTCLLQTVSPWILWVHGSVSFSRLPTPTCCRMKSQDTLNQPVSLVSEQTVKRQYERRSTFTGFTLSQHPSSHIWFSSWLILDSVSESQMLLSHMCLRFCLDTPISEGRNKDFTKFLCSCENWDTSLTHQKAPNVSQLKYFKVLKERWHLIWYKILTRQYNLQSVIQFFP